MAHSFRGVVIALLATLTVVGSGHRLMNTSATNWNDAHATFYGGLKGEDTMSTFLYSSK